ncbi:MAG: endonuclease/exonuclease/phosphatase family protein [Candidatus Electryonea clarkiae]|nr:endonuclease/exonuclease/phosphatase family protein [Candidatus Electryonea clarkiae]MDP8286727.1 endonuclease/exonuclease/phosphatase family protein [Candidatus Electryonea clarkiae]
MPENGENNDGSHSNKYKTVIEDPSLIRAGSSHRKSHSGHKSRKKHKRSPKRWGIEKRVGTGLLLAVAILTVLLRYLPGYPLMSLEWLIGNQLFRIGLIPFILLLGFFYKASRHIAGFVVLLGLAAILIGEAIMFIPLLPPEKVDISPDQRLRVLTYNVGMRYPAGLVEHLDSELVDIACLQEVYVYNIDSLMRDAERLGFQTHFLKLRDDAGGGLILMHKGKLINIQTIEAESFNNKKRRFMAADILWGERQIRLVLVHFESNSRKRGFAGFLQAWNLRTIQANLVSEIADTSSVPNIVIGDFNATPTDRSIRELRKNMTDAWYKGGHLIGGTWHLKYPFLRIDEVLYNGFTDAANAKVIPHLRSSDHRALQVDLLW